MALQKKQMKALGVGDILFNESGESGQVNRKTPFSIYVKWESGDVEHIDNTDGARLSLTKPEQKTLADEVGEMNEILEAGEADPER